MYVLVDRESGNALAITLWESREAMHASEEMGASSREEVVRIADLSEAEGWDRRVVMGPLCPGSR